MFGMSFERASHMHLEDLRREAYVEAQVRQVRGRPADRLAAALRALAARLDGGVPSVPGAWHEDVRSGRAGRVHPAGRA